MVTVRDYGCRAGRGGPGHEEESTTNNVVLMRHGVFSRHFGRRHVTADVNQVAFFAKGSTYRVSHSTEHGDRGTVFEVCPRVLGDFLRELDPASADATEPVFPFAAGPCDTGHFWRHRELVLRLEGAEAAPLEPLWADAAALQLVADVLEAGYARHGSPRKKRRAGTVEAHADRVEAVKALLASRMTERLTLGEVAEEVHVSPFHLARLFRQGTGVPIHRYLTRLRLRASLERLAGDGTDLTTIALDLGFASHSHFADAFRREFACPPSRVRRAGGRALSEMRRNLEV
jgi:AraC-like DNA-binding protein